ncbi:MAG: hypothetical protein IAG10_31395 [Planctomycetaceae bacterium]|nr:hypothetical protein [Planctomycetaceae bacterium]
MTERRSKLLVIAAVWLSFLVASLASAPIPAVNEPHYLAMARHYWDSSWCAGDSFLQSFPAHRVFYQTFGWLTLWLDLATVALLGRAVSLAMLAASWTALAIRLQRDNSPNPSRAIAALLSAWLFLGMQAVGKLSGEWLIGGFESKVVAYACVFWAVTAMLDRRLIAAAVCSGVAISFHPIVGMWHVTALVITELANLKSQISNGHSSRRWLLAAALLAVTALPGLLPAVQMLNTGNARTAFAANFIQVHYRLKHHLDPMDFDRVNCIAYGCLAVLWLAVVIVLKRQQKLAQPDRWWIGYVLAAALFALAGWLVGYGPRPIQFMPGYQWRIALLKFYPFRLFDLLLPIAIAILLPRLVKQRWLWLVGAVGLTWALVSTLVFPLSNQLPSAMRADWRDACRWVAANTPADAVFHTPDEAEAFKWFAQRGEFVNRKDCPQDAAGIVEWNDRLKQITKWSERSFADDQKYSTDELRELVRDTGGIRYAIIRAGVRYEADLLYANNRYKILRLPEAESSSGR